MLQLYYLYCRFRHIKIEQAGQPKLVFKDQGREISITEQPTRPNKDESEVPSGDEEMGIIEEEDSLDFNSSLRSKTESYPHSS
jgi:hypothetical protein